MNPFDKIKEAYQTILQWEADERAGVAGTTDKPEAKSASEALLYVERLLQEALLQRRNCDMGTAEEQTRRMANEYCHVQKDCYESPSGKSCPLYKTGVDCRLIWAQMPYEGGVK